MDFKLKGSYQYEAVGPVKLSSEGRNILEKTFYQLDEDIKRQIKCYSLLGILALKTPFFIHTISDKSWFEINNSIDKDKAEKFIKTI